MRYHGLDLARAVLMLLGVFYHASSLYAEGSVWQANSELTDPLFNYFGAFIRYFRMEMFFVIAGFFFVMVYERKGWLEAMKGRLIRVIVPLVVVGATLNTVMHAYDQKDVVFNLDYVLNGNWLGHLWFIGALVVYYVFFSPLLTFFKTKENAIKQWQFCVFAFAVIPFLIAGSAFVGVKIRSTNFLFVDVLSLYLHGAYFFLGMVAWKYRDVVLPMMTLKSALYVFLFMVCALVLMVDPESNEMLSWSMQNVWNAFFGMCIGVICLCILIRIGQYPHPLITRMVAVSYSIYIFHQPILIIVFVLFFAGSVWDPFPSYVALCGVVFGISYFFHVVVEKHPVALFLFNGIPINELRTKVAP